ncbi:MAG TPA: hypothetical protein VG674_05990 [Amycolatopsis sp.]|nr:hypothetical protein [Amycolatopsis sp.]
MDEDDVRTLFADTPAGPPLSLTAPGVIAHGARIRRRRKRWAVAGSSLGTVAVLALAGVAVGHRGPAEPSPIEPAGPGLSTIAPSGSPSPTPSPPTAVPTGGRPSHVLPDQAPNEPPLADSATPTFTPATPTRGPRSATRSPSVPVPGAPSGSALPTTTRR